MTEIRKWHPPYPLTGNCFAFGRIGSGKSFKLKAVSEFYYEKGYKIFDIFGGKRGEGPFWVFPSDELKMWREFEKVVGIMKNYGPKEYPVCLGFPFFKNLIPDELPEKKPRISCKPFTIYFKDITISDISLVLGSVVANAKYVWNYILKHLPDNACGQDILNLFSDKTKLSKYKELNLYKNFILPLCEQQILVGKNCKYNLDLIQESKKKDEIFVLVDEYVPKEFKFFIMGYILRKLFYDYVNKDLTHKRNIALFRELSLFMKVIDDASQDGEQKQAFRNLFVDIARYARSGLFLFGDTQSPAEVKGCVAGSEDLIMINEMPSPYDRDAACEQLRRDMRISAGQIAYISTMPVWECVVVERGQKAKLIRRIQPPRTKCWKQDDVNFFQAWKKIYNEYTNIVSMKNDLIEQNLLAKSDYSLDIQEDEEDEEVIAPGNDYEDDTKIVEEINTSERKETKKSLKTVEIIKNKQKEEKKQMKQKKEILENIANKLDEYGI